MPAKAGIQYAGAFAVHGTTGITGSSAFADDDSDAEPTNTA